MINLIQNALKNLANISMGSPLTYFLITLIRKKYTSAADAMGQLRTLYQVCSLTASLLLPHLKKLFM